MPKDTARHREPETAATREPVAAGVDVQAAIAVDHAKLRHHGDVEVRPGMLDFAVNVQGNGPPEWLRERLSARLSELGRYPDAGEEAAARAAVAARHGRRADEVLLLAGAAEGFAMLPRLGSRLAALIHPSFTEPELALREAGVPVVRVLLEPPYTLDSRVTWDPAQPSAHHATPPRDEKSGLEGVRSHAPVDPAAKRDALGAAAETSLPLLAAEKFAGARGGEADGAVETSGSSLTPVEFAVTPGGAAETSLPLLAAEELAGAPDGEAGAAAGISLSPLAAGELAGGWEGAVGAGGELAALPLPADGMTGERVWGASVVPEEADLVVIGNPTNPTSVLHSAEMILRLRRPGRVLVVDEAFMDAVAGESESLSRMAFPDVLVLRSLTKTWALAGLRCGYFLGAPEVLARLNHGRPHWPLGTLQLEAVAATAEPRAVAEARGKAESIADDRAAMIPRLRELGIEVREPAAGPFVLIRVPDAELLRKRLADKGIAVRRGDTFPGLDAGHLRLAVRPAAEVDRLVAAIREVGL